MPSKLNWDKLENWIFVQLPNGKIITLNPEDLQDLEERLLHPFWD